jgi:hypothetical protein
MVMGDGTAWRGDGAYATWERKQTRKKLCEKWLYRFLVALFFFFIGMGFQYVRDAEIRDMARANITRDLIVIETMPDTTEEQKASARSRLKKVSPEYLNERKPKK